ncbi:tRNA (guanosine(46)-N7)-methyltransferase TrmB [Crenothrix polyspora]|uniref:tRNA (guanine-N(7)-)-methyltransferase n=1 Tax=Crenothrix polyspora TaxID=360316 RepID=A0A1R4H6I0_9GAMM|nr:tRNA (guanosine(46)-N7)-methyltransferase TrmB [Crenothrix polyspora]SJM91470.1 tRNA (m7G46) methyltransferase, SAM-dependent [Crenothrix polyspora]
MTSPAPTVTPRIRSFMPRQGRITAGQEFSLENYWMEYGLDTNIHYDFAQVFGRDAPLIIEIGFGNGESLAKMAAENPDNNYIGIEVHRPGVGHLLMLIKQNGITNLKIYNHDAIDILENHISDNSLGGVHLFFPDPWPKQRHHKRRIVRPSFIEVLLKKLRVNGYFHTATDWENYAKHILDMLTPVQGFNNTSPTHTYCERPDYRPLTKFEQRGIRLGHGVWDLVFTKN